MDERPVATARASVMMYDAANNIWIASGSSQGISKVQLFRHQVNNTYRVVGWKLNDKEVVLNCAIYRGLKYNQARVTFHQWRDTKHQVYGLNFTNKEEAESFANAISEALEELNVIYRQSQLMMQQQQQQQLDASNPGYYSQQQQPQQIQHAPTNNIVYQQQQSQQPVPTNQATPPVQPEYAQPQKLPPSEELVAGPPAPPAAAPPPPPPGPPPAVGAPPPPPPGPPPIPASVSQKQPAAPQPDSDDDNVGGLAAQLRQAKLKSRPSTNSTPPTSTTSAATADPPASSTINRSAGGGDNMISEMQRVLAARKKAKGNADPAGVTDNGDTSGVGGAKWKQQPLNSINQHNRTPSDCETAHLNGGGSINNSSSCTSNTSKHCDVNKSSLMQCATLGRKSSLQPNMITDNNTPVTRQDLDNFKKEIVAEVRQMMTQFKLDVLEAIRTQRP